LSLPLHSVKNRQYEPGKVTYFPVNHFNNSPHKFSDSCTKL